jgi:hypothetical protein
VLCTDADELDAADAGGDDAERVAAARVTPLLIPAVTAAQRRMQMPFIGVLQAR